MLKVCQRFMDDTLTHTRRLWPVINPKETTEKMFYDVFEVFFLVLFNLRIMVI